ncbi:MAG TPA: DUF72 domain-containing protein [Vicinamibacterales bacterium]|jgi:uncharacterized protein YecE (DUF72 family)
MRTPSSDVRIGTSGWSYPSGKGTWNGVFYPKPRSRDFDELAYYAEHFDTVEVNSTFYGQPRADVCRRWAERTPSGFEFSVKLYQKFTHPRMFGERVAKQIGTAVAGNLGPADTYSDAIAALAGFNQADLDEFRRGIEPIATADKLGALLAQFPPSFKDTPDSREALAALLRAFHEYPIAVELRHKSWSDSIGDTLTLLNGFKAAWVQIDEPKFRFSIRQNYLPNVKGFYYMRLHGRNAANWWKHDKSEDRYNYLYSADELQEFVETARATTRLVKKTYLYTNNHFSAKSVANAVMIKRQLGQPIEGEFPPEFIEKYPELKSVIAPTSARSDLLAPISPERPRRE